MADGKRKTMGFWSIVLFGMTTIIGAGIFLLPSGGAQLMGVGSIAVFIFDAILAISLALCFAKAATYFDKDGSSYLYAKEAFGGFVGFEVGIITWVVGFLQIATMVAGLTEALGIFFPVLNGQVGRMTFISILIIGLALLNMGGVSLSKVVINIFTVSKIVPLVLLISFGLFFMKGIHFSPVLPANGNVLNDFGQAAILLFYAYTGFEAMGLVAGEMKNPKKDLPRAIITAVLIIAVFYILIQTVAIGVLGVPALAASKAPLQMAFGRIAGPIGLTIIAVGTAISMTGNLIANSFSIPHSGVALADNHMLPKAVGRRNQYNAPYVSIIITTLVVLGLSYSGTFVQLAMLSVIARFAQYIPTCLSVIVFSKTKEEKADQFRLPFGWFIPIFATLVSLWLLFQKSWEEIAFGLGALVIAAPLYFLTDYYKEKKAEKVKHSNLKEAK